MIFRILEDLPAEKYHGGALDKEAGEPMLSQSVAKVLLNHCPRKAWAIHPLLGGAKAEEEEEVSDAGKKARATGTWLHQYFLGGRTRFQLLPYSDFRAKKAREDRDAAEAEGKIPILEGRLAELEEAAGCIHASLIQGDEANGIEPIDLFGPNWKKEVAVVWEEETPEGPVLCHARLDMLDLAAGLIPDLKFVRNAHPAAFGRSFKMAGYDMQRVAYTRAIEAVAPEMAGRLDFWFITIEPFSPYCWHVPHVTGTMNRLGELRWQRACRIWRKCLDSGYWPMYPGEPVDAREYELEEELLRHINQLGQAPPGRPDPEWYTEELTDARS